MRHVLKYVGTITIALVVAAAALVLPLLWIEGAVWAGHILLPFTNVLTSLLLVVALLILVPLAVFESTRGISAGALLLVSRVFGASLWITGLLLTYTQWGATGVFIGLALLGIGVVPIGLLVTILNGAWAYTVRLVVLGAATYACRLLGVYVLAKQVEADQRALAEQTMRHEIERLRERIQTLLSQPRQRSPLDRAAAAARRQLRATVQAMSDAELNATVAGLRASAATNPTRLTRQQFEIALAEQARRAAADEAS